MGQIQYSAVVDSLNVRWARAERAWLACAHSHTRSSPRYWSARPSSRPHRCLRPEHGRCSSCRSRDIPDLGNFDFGHAGPNLPMPVGIRVGLDAQQRTLSLLEPAVGPHATAGPVS
ncbi:hypothetical protein HDA40_007908 [Hamadaea flava]|uniref:Uncharacterized protein n=1 Tax=Hamadaea flava TaxID=1742688 RepID=A0ABV8LZS9_9ACTN|nr:hypothetical protein [Hamadaea flava]MCP2329401.1 hypothetical protein [Hamadaea flava]